MKTTNVDVVDHTGKLLAQVSSRMTSIGVSKIVGRNVEYARVNGRYVWRVNKHSPKNREVLADYTMGYGAGKVTLCKGPYKSL